MCRNALCPCGSGKNTNSVVIGRSHSKHEYGECFNKIREPQSHGLDIPLIILNRLKNVIVHQLFLPMIQRKFIEKNWS
ncbi:MAG: SEC-C domain-containing protein [Desulfovibrio sp.]|nr:SEC-C domain-containing protein [Desulfovibrio sp.]